MFLSLQLGQRYDPDVMKGIHVNLQTSARRSKRPDLGKSTAQLSLGSDHSGASVQPMRCF